MGTRPTISAPVTLRPLAAAALEHGAHGIRINPGNLGGPDKLKRVVDAARHHRAPIRVGVNSGSIAKDILDRLGYPTPERPDSLIESALDNARQIEALGYGELKISIKSPDALTTIAAYRRNIAEPTQDLGIRILDQYIDSAKTPDFLPTVSPTAAPVSQNQNLIADTEESSVESQEMVSSQPVQLFITANQRTLMKVVCDGKEVFSGRTIPNNTYPFDAENLIELTTGNADALSVVYNQHNLGRLGKIGEVMTIDFSPFSAATPTPQFSPTPTNTFEPTYTPLPETPLPTNTPTPYIP